MKTQSIQKSLSLLLALLMTALTLAPASSAVQADGDVLTLILTLDHPALIDFVPADSTVGDFAAAEAGAVQLDAIGAAIDAAWRAVRKIAPDAELLAFYSVLMCGFAITASRSDLAAIAAIPGVADVSVSGEYEAAALDPAAFLSNAEEGMSALMAYAPEIIGIAEDDGRSTALDGAGTVIAILDSSFDVEHEVFVKEPAEARLTAESVSALAVISNAFQIGKQAGVKNSDFYVSPKIPFAYDYAADDTDVLSIATHGTHVAGIAAGKSADFSGIAPEAQLLMMKVFNDDNVCLDLTIVSALEDAILFGADAVNLSLGSVSGRADALSVFGLQKVLDAAEKAGVVVVCAAGNEGRGGSKTKYDTGEDTADPPASLIDYGYVADPSVARSAISVGSVTNSVVYRKTVYAADESKIRIFDPSYVADGSHPELDFIRYFVGQTLPYEVIPGLGEPKDYEEIDVSGKIALVQRGTITFQEKLTAAAKAGAVGILVYDNEKETDTTVTMQIDDPIIPIAFITKESGKILAEADEKTIHLGDTPYEILKAAAPAVPASYSSWGTTDELLLKPEIMTVGGSILSSINGGYSAAAGTSMASPMAAGAAALLAQKFKAEQPDLTGSDLTAKIKTRLMNAAIPMRNNKGIEYSPRQQGAGLLAFDLAEALDFTVTGVDPLGDVQAKTELYEIDPAGFSFDITVTNEGADAREFSFGASILGDGYYSRTVEGEKVYFISDESMLLSGNVMFSEKTVTVPAGESKVVSVSIALTKDEIGARARIFENGYYVEGYVYVTANDGKKVSLPYMGFAGDWAAAPLFTSLAYGDDALYPQYLLYTLHTNYLIAGTYAADKENIQYLSSLVAFSPNGDTAGDTLMMQFYPLRNIHSYKIFLTDSEGEELQLYESAADEVLNKTCFDANGNGGYSAVVWDGSDGVNNRYIMDEGNYTVRLEALGPDSRTDSLTFTVFLDKTAPVLQNLALENDNGKKRIRIEAADNHYLMSAAVYLPNIAVEEMEVIPEGEMYLFESSVTPEYKEGERKYTIDLDFEGYPLEYGYFYLELIDYALNIVTYRIEFTVTDSGVEIMLPEELLSDGARGN